MPIVTSIQSPKKDSAVAEVFTDAKAFFGHVPNLVKALASNQAMCTTITRFMMESLGDGKVEWVLKELIILKTLRAMKSYYSYGAHEKLAVSLGVSDDKLGDLAGSLWKASPHYEEKERLVFELVDQIAKDANAVSQDIWDRLRVHFDEGQLIEINAVITTFLMIGRVGDALGVADPVLFSKEI
ncbi:MAG: carboxymuconolactone decarboxylase family protein [Bacteroidota bacterium]